MINFLKQQLLANIKATYYEKSKKIMSDDIIMNIKYRPTLLKHNLNGKRHNAESCSSISLDEWYVTLGPQLFH